MRQQAKYIEIAGKVLLQIRGLAPGSRCPGINQLTADYGIARATAERVLRRLVQQGHVRQIAGKGTFVAERPSRRISVLCGGGPDGEGSAADQRLAEQIVSRLRESSYQAELLVGPEAPGPGIQAVAAGQPDLVVTVYLASTRYLEELGQLKRPIVCVGATPFNLPVDLVFSATLRAGYVASRSLLEAGLRNVWYLGAYQGMPNASVVSLTHGIGFHMACQDLGLEDAPGRIRLALQADQIDAMIEELLGRRPVPQGVITADSGIGRKVLAAAKRRGLRVPDDLAVLAGMGHEPTSVSCLTRHHARMVSIVDHVIWHRFQEPDRPPQDALVRPQFVDVGTVPLAAARYIRAALPQEDSPMIRSRL